MQCFEEGYFDRWIELEKSSKGVESCMLVTYSQSQWKQKEIRQSYILSTTHHRMPFMASGVHQQEGYHQMLSPQPWTYRDPNPSIPTLNVTSAVSKRKLTNTLCRVGILINSLLEGSNATLPVTGTEWLARQSWTKRLLRWFEYAWPRECLLIAVKP